MKKILMATALMLGVGLSAGVYAGTGWKITINNKTDKTIYITSATSHYQDWRYFIGNNISQEIKSGSSKGFYAETHGDPHMIDYNAVEYMTFGISSAPVSQQHINEGLLNQGTGFVIFESSNDHTPTNAKQTTLYNTNISGNVINKALVTDDFWAGIFKPENIVVPVTPDSTKGKVENNGNDFNITSQFNNSAKGSYGHVGLTINVTSNNQNNVATLP